MFNVFQIEEAGNFQTVSEEGHELIAYLRLKISPAARLPRKASVQVRYQLLSICSREVRSFVFWPKVIRVGATAVLPEFLICFLALFSELSSKVISTAIYLFLHNLLPLRLVKLIYFRDMGWSTMVCFDIAKWRGENHHLAISIIRPPNIHLIVCHEISVSMDNDHRIILIQISHSLDRYGRRGIADSVIRNHLNLFRQTQGINAVFERFLAFVLGANDAVCTFRVELIQRPQIHENVGQIFALIRFDFSIFHPHYLGSR